VAQVDPGHNLTKKQGQENCRGQPTAQAQPITQAQYRVGKEREMQQQYNKQELRAFIHLVSIGSKRLTRKVSLLRDITEILNKFHFKSVGIQEIDVSSIGLIGTIFGHAKAGFGQAVNYRVNIAGNKRKMGQARLVTRQVSIAANPIVVKRQVLVIIPKVKPFSRLSRPLTLSRIPNAPVGKRRLVKFQGGGYVADNQIQMFQVKHNLFLRLVVIDFRGMLIPQVRLR
jgi:hypothetical protein